MHRAAFALLLSALLAIPLRAEPCAITPERLEEEAKQALERQRQQAPAIASETALLVWDPVGKLQHFVRTVDFKTGGESLGFIVPVPNTPEIAEADQKLFPALAVMTHPPEPTDGVVLLDRFTWPWVGHGTVEPTPPPSTKKYITMFAAISRDDPPEPKPVRVIATKDVAGLTATTLEATDPTALGKWLTENGFQSPDGFEPWAKVYVEQKWKFVAFKLAPKKEGAEPTTLTMNAIRISTPTERPYYPYREPPLAVQGRGDRLTLYLLSPVPLVGQFAKEIEWNARRPYAETRFLGEAVRAALPGVALPMRAWLAEQVDASWSRPDAELEFFRAPDLPEVNRGEIQYLTSVLVVRWQPLALIAGLSVLLALALVIARLGRMRRA